MPNYDRPTRRPKPGAGRPFRPAGGSRFKSRDDRPERESREPGNFGPKRGFRSSEPRDRAPEGEGPKRFSDRPPRRFDRDDSKPRRFGPPRPYSSDRREGGGGEDRPKRFSDRPPRRFDRDDSKPRHFGPPRPYSSDRREGGEGGEDRPRHFSDRPPRRFDRDDSKPRRFGPPRPYSSDRREGGEGGDDRPKRFSDRPPRRFDRDDSKPRRFGPPSRPYSSDRREGGEGEDRPRRFGPPRPYSSDRGERGEDRPRRPYSSDRGEDRPRRPYSSDRREGGEDRPRRFSDRGPRPEGGGERRPFVREEREPRRFGPGFGPGFKPKETSEPAEGDSEESASGTSTPVVDESAPDDSYRTRPEKYRYEPNVNLPKLVASGGYRPRKEPRVTVSVEQVTSPKAKITWVYDNMVAAQAGEITNGGTVYLYDINSKFLGSAIYNENSRIRARLFSLEHKEFGPEYLSEAIGAAVERRRPFFTDEDSYRVVFSDADFVPGLIVDKLGKILVVQLLTLAADTHADAIIADLEKRFSPEGIVIKRDMPIREKEGLEIKDAEIRGEVVPPIRLEVDGVTVLADPLGGQKTGLFLDQRFNRRLVKRWCEGKRVLDLFCYAGAWAIMAAQAGASDVVAVDSSEDAIKLGEQAVEANGITNVHFVKADCFEYVSEAVEKKRHFDVVVCDPPAFAKSRKHVTDAVKAYLSLNYRAMKLLHKGGILVTCSCSQHVSSGEFEEMLETASRNARMQFHMLERAGQPPDHPVLLGFPESEYLKCYVLQRVE